MKRHLAVAVAVGSVAALILAACGQPPLPGSAKATPRERASPAVSPSGSTAPLGMGRSQLAVLPGGAAWVSIEVGKKGWSKAWLYGTTDGGKTWTAITVAGLGSVGYLRIFDANRGVIVDEAGSAVYSTDDAGAHWWRYTLPVPADGTVPASFVNTLEGWALLSGNTGTSVLYHTADRGKTWDKVVVPSSYVYPGSVFFRDSRNGWLGHQGLSGPELFQTTDGGRTWRTVGLSAPPIYPGIVAFVGPVRAGGGVLFTQVSVAEGSQAVGSPGSMYVYSSADDGVHWTNGTRVWSGPTVDAGPPLIEVASPTLWFAAIGDRLRVTGDAGRTWTTHSMASVPGFMNDELVLATATEGYLLRARSSIWTCLHECFRLERTTDSGASWESVDFPELASLLPTQ